MSSLAEQPRDARNVSERQRGTMPRKLKTNVRRFQNRQARLETQEDLKPALDEILRRVLPADHPALKEKRDDQKT